MGQPRSLWQSLMAMYTLRCLTCDRHLSSPPRPLFLVVRSPSLPDTVCVSTALSQSALSPMPSLGMMTINALVAADSVIIPSQPNFLSTKGLNLLLRSISKIKRQINPRLKIDGILLTMVDNRTNNAKTIISSLRSTVGENIRVFRSEIPFSVRAAECSLYGESIFSHDRSGRVAAAYAALTKEVTLIEERAKNRSGSDRVR